MHRVVTCCVVLLAGLLPAKFVAAAEWKAAAAKVNITPKTFMWMSGYGGRSRPAEGKLTDLWAKALAIEDAAGNRGVLVTMDLVGIDRGISSRVCRILASKHKLRREQIILSTTHTHTGPVVGDNLRAMYSFNNDQQRLVDAYTKRLLRRHFVIDAGASYEQTKALFEKHLPREADMFGEYHALLVSLGKRFCRPKARCDSCPLCDWNHDADL